MVVRVRLRVRSVRGGPLEELTVLVNGGAHSPRPVLVVDEETAGKLNYRGEQGEVVEASVADSKREVYLIKDAVELTLMDGGEELSRLKAHLVIHPGLEEPIITDATIDELGITVLSFSKGLWRHVNDPPNKVRRSALA